MNWLAIWSLVSKGFSATLNTSLPLSFWNKLVQLMEKRGGDEASQTVESRSLSWELPLRDYTMKFNAQAQGTKSLKKPRSSICNIMHFLKHYKSTKICFCFKKHSDRSGCPYLFSRPLFWHPANACRYHIIESERRNGNSLKPYQVWVSNFNSNKQHANWPTQFFVIKLLKAFP